MMSINEYYDGFCLTNVDIDNLNSITSIDELFKQEPNAIRIKAPAEIDYQLELEKRGFFRADRMLKASINLKKDLSDISKKIRRGIVASNDYKEEIFNIALKSFSVDRRFHVKKIYDNDLAGAILKRRIYEIHEFYLVFFKDIPIGFAGIDEVEMNSYEIKLAAVDEKYRMMGTAFSLYGSLAINLAERGATQLFGWISTVNVAVMNLYSALGASFSEPSDIYLWEKK